MSVFRFLSPTRSVGSSSSSPSRRRDEIRVRLHVPSYGTVFMPYPAISPGEPRTDHEFRGDLEVEVPRGWGRVKCRAIRVGLKTVSILDMGLGRGIEEDTIFERKAEIRGGTVDGIMLEEGLHYFDWTLILPSTLAPHDWHPGARVKHILYGEVEGIPDVSFASNFLRRTSFASSSSTPPSRSRSNSPPLFSPGASLSILRQDIALPQPPTYNYSEYGTDDVEWLRGTAYGERTIMLLFNPDPAGGVSSLDMRINGGAEGIGPFDIRFLSDVWTVCASLHAKITLASPSPEATIYHIRVGLAQKARITSPRDDPATTKPIVIERFFPILAHGGTPPSGRSTGEGMTPIWKHGGGSDELIFNGQGRLPDDTLGRPSTLEGNETPIQVSHRLLTEVWLSVYGENQFGQPLEQPGPGELRVLRIEKPVIVPTCFLIPSVLNLPLYDPIDACEMWGRTTCVCPLCKTPVSEQWCKTCPFTGIPHTRHDHDEKLVGNVNGVCSLCAQRCLPSDEPNQKQCACGLNILEQEERMKRLAMEEDGLEGNESRQQREQEKEEGERGRARARV